MTFSWEQIIRLVLPGILLQPQINIYQWKNDGRIFNQLTQELKQIRED